MDINKNGYALIPLDYSKRYRYKALVTETIQPKEQYIAYKIAVIAAYHPKYHTIPQIKRFVRHMTRFMKRCGLEYKLFLLTQHNTHIDFNMGYLYNVGFEMAMLEGYEKFVFQDVFLLPHTDMIPYYRRDTKFPIHLGYHWQEFAFNQVYHLGIMMFNRDNFQHINGYPINIEGLYGWDYEVVLRLKDTQLTLKLPVNGTILANGKHPRMNVEEWRKVKTSHVINRHTETWKSNGLNTTFYSLENLQKRAHDSELCDVFTVNIVDYTYFLISTENVVFDVVATTDVSLPSFQIVDSGAPEVPLKELGYVKMDETLLQKVTIPEHVRSDATLKHHLMASEYIIDMNLNKYLYGDFWKNCPPTKPTINSIITKLELYTYEPLRYIQNRFSYIRSNTFKVSTCRGIVL